MSHHSASSENPSSYHQQQRSTDSTDAQVLNVSHGNSPDARGSHSLTSPLTEDYDVEDFDDLFDDAESDCSTEEKVHEQSGQESGHPLERRHSENGNANEEESPRVDCPQNAAEPDVHVSKNQNIEDSIRDLEKEALERHVHNIAQDVLYYLEKILTMFIVAYEQLDNPEGRDLCYACVEEPFFRPIWKYLLALFR